MDAVDDVQPVGHGVDGAQGFGVQPAGAVARQHVGVVAIDDEGLGPVGADGGDQAGVGAHALAAGQDRLVVLDLADDQHPLSVGRPVGGQGGAHEIVFRHSGLDHAATQATGALDLIRRQGRLLDQGFQTAGTARVVIDPQVVQRDGQGAEEVRTQALGADEAVLDPHRRAVEGGGGDAHRLGLLARPPGQAAAGRGGVADRGARRADEADPALGAVQQATDRAALGRGETGQGPVARQPIRAVAQGDQTLQHLFGLTPTARDGIDVAAVGDQGGGGDLFDRPRHAPAAGVDGVRRQPPAGIEGRAETGDRQPTQQGLEPQRRGHAIDRVHDGQQIGGPHVGVDQGHPLQIGRGDAALFASGGHGRVAFDDDLGVRVLGLRGGQHGAEAVGAGQAVADGGVVQRLIHHQHPPARMQDRRVQRRAHIGLGHARGDDAVDQGAGAGRHVGVAPIVGGRDQPLQAAGPRRVVINAHAVDHQAEAGGAGLAQADRAQETVLQGDIGPLLGGGPAAARLGRRLHAPAYDGAHAALGQAPQIVFRQEGRQVRNLQHPRRADPGGSPSGDGGRSDDLGEGGRFGGHASPLLGGRRGRVDCGRGDKAGGR